MPCDTLPCRDALGGLSASFSVMIGTLFLGPGKPSSRYPCRSLIVCGRYNSSFTRVQIVSLSATRDKKILYELFLPFAFQQLIYSPDIITKVLTLDRLPNKFRELEQ